MSYPDLNTPELEPQIQEWVEILGAAHKKSLYPDWLNDELNGFPPPRFRHLSSRYGFQLPLRKPQARLSWLADPTERDNWEKAFRLQHSLPILDPNQVDDSELRYMRLDVLGNPDGNSPALRLWRERKTAQNQRKIELNGILDSVATDSEKFSSVLGATDRALGWSESELQELIQQDQAGISVQKRLEQLQLNYPRFAFLKKIQQKISNGGTAVTENEWVQVIGIVLQCEKMLEYPQWRWEEQQEGISISPAFFYLKETINQEAEGTPTPRFDLSTEEKAKRDLENQWLRNIPAHSEWKSTLKARIDQVNTLQNSLLALVDNAEEQTLTLLQDAMVFKVTQEEETLEKKKQILAEKRLLNMDIGPCHKTTRVAEAIRVLQTLLWAIHTDTLSSTQLFSWGFNAGRPGVDAFEVADSFEADWQWMGSYPAWRAAMFVFLYPQNYLDPAVNNLQSWGFKKMINEKLAIPITPENACEAAKYYSDYFNDVMNLEVQASCSIFTYLKPVEQLNCETDTVLTEMIHLFALAKERGLIYTAKHSRHFGSDEIDSWVKVPGVSNTIQILGSAPHETPEGKTFILLFVKVRKDRKYVLQMIRFDIQASNWLNAVELDDLPPGAGNDFTGVIVLKRAYKETLSVVENPNNAIEGASQLSQSPTLLILRIKNGRVFSRKISDYGDDWDGEWDLIIGKNKGIQYKKLLALHQRSREEFVLLLEAKNGKVHYKEFFATNGSTKDDGRLKELPFGKYVGSFSSLNSEEINVFHRDSTSKLRMSTIYPSIQDNTTPEIASNISEFNKKLISIFGIDLSDWYFNYTIDLSGLFYRTEDGTKIPINFELKINDNIVDIFKKIERIPNRWWSYFDDQYYDFLELYSEFDLKVDNKWELLLKYGISSNDVADDDFSKGYLVDLLLDYHFSPKKLKEIFKTWLNEVGSVHDSKHGDWVYANKTIGRHIESAHSFDDDPPWSVKEITDYSLVNLIFSFGPFEYAELGSRTTQIKFYGLNSSFSHKTIAYNTESNFAIIPLSSGFNYPQMTISTNLTCKGGDKLYFIKWNVNNDLFIKNSRHNILINSSERYFISPSKANEDIQSYKETVSNVYNLFSSSSQRLMQYLYEAFHGLPIAIAQRLQLNGFFSEALDWYGIIYHYNGILTDPKIDYLLILNSSNSVSSNFTRSENWLSDPLDSHGIAKGRKDSYTSYVVQQIIRCLVEYADAEFTIDNVESNERARRLYEKALELFNTPELYFSSESNCGKLLREFEIEVLMAIKLGVPELRTPLLKIRDFKKLESTITALRRITQNANQSPAEKVAAMYSLVQQVVQEQPGVKTLGAIMSQGEQDLQKLEPWVLSRPMIQAKLHKSLRRKGTHALNRIATFANTTRETLENTVVYLPALRGSMRRRIPIPPRPHPGPIPAPIPAVWWTGYSFVHSLILPVSFEFCVPQNPILSPLYERASINLFKLNHCMNIAGMKRDLQPYAAATDAISGMPTLGRMGQWNLPGVFNRIGNKLLPTLYRYAFLVNRAKELTQLAMQIEASLLAALEKRDEESLRLLQARQSVEMAQLSVRLQDLRVTESFQGVVLAGLQQDRADLQAGHYQRLLNQGRLESEQKSLDLLNESRKKQYEAAAMYYTSYGLLQTAAVVSLALDIKDKFKGGGQFLSTQASAFSTLGQGLATTAGALSTESSIYNTKASYERQAQDWAFQKNLAEQDVVIGAQQIQLAKIQTQIAQQEREISIQQVVQAQEILQFLLNKTTGYALYDWMVSILKQSYNYFLQMATATARLAENQLSFERQETAPAIIQTNYWNMPGYTGPESKELGLTGSTRLMTDLSKLDQYAVDTDQRKSHFMVRLSFAQFFPLELQQLRETGQMTFATTLQMIEERFPGAYLCQIKEVALSVIALTDPVEGIKAMLYSSGVSRVVVGPYTFQTININRSPEMNVYSGASIDNTGRFDLIADQSATMFLPFENAGFETLWQLDLPRNANAFNFESIADVILSIKCTALFSMDYQSQVLKRLQKEFSAVRTFSFRTEFADQWYDLHHPDLSANPMVVTFNTGRTDFPSRMQNIRIQQIALYFVKADNALFEVPVNALLFAEEATSGRVGGSAQTNERMINTRFGNGASWVSMIGRKPIGEWELDLTGTLEGIEGYLSDGNPLLGLSVRDLFEQGEIRDVLFAVTYSGVRPV